MRNEKKIRKAKRKEKKGEKGIKWKRICREKGREMEKKKK